MICTHSAPIRVDHNIWLYNVSTIHSYCMSLESICMFCVTTCIQMYMYIVVCCIALLFV